MFNSSSAANSENGLSNACASSETPSLSDMTKKVSHDAAFNLNKKPDLKPGLKQTESLSELDMGRNCGFDFSVRQNNRETKDIGIQTQPRTRPCGMMAKPPMRDVALTASPRVRDIGVENMLKTKSVTVQTDPIHYISNPETTWGSDRSVSSHLSANSEVDEVSTSDVLKRLLEWSTKTVPVPETDFANSVVTEDLADDEEPQPHSVEELEALLRNVQAENNSLTVHNQMLKEKTTECVKTFVQALGVFKELSLAISQAKEQCGPK